MRDLRKTASIEGDELVIRVPIEAIGSAAEAGWACNKIKTRWVVTDPDEAAKSMLRMLLKESEDGTTRIDMMLDWAVNECGEYGEEGLEPHEDQGHA